MVDRGSCTFVTKTQNVEKMGGKFAIIVDDKYERTDLIQMIDDGRGYLVHTPAYLISKEDGDRFK